MKLRYGIPLTLGLMLASSWLSRPDGFNAYYVLVVVTAVWVAYDSSRIRIREYRTQLALPPIPLGVATAIIWPLMFPLYLRTRHRIVTGQIPRGELRQRVWIWLSVFAAIVLVPAGFAWWATRDVRRDLLPLAEGIAREFSTAVNLTVQAGGLAVVTLPAAAAPDSARRDLAFRVAQYTHAHHVPELRSVVVRYVDVEKRGALTITREMETFEWSRADLRSARSVADDTTNATDGG